MAGDWLKVEAATPDKPEVFEIAVQLKITPAEAFGRLFLVWRWFDQHTETGNAHNVTSAYLDHIAGVTGFAEAMKNVGWLAMQPDGSFGCSLPNFDRHNGKTAKTRVLTAKRVATHKLRNGNGALTQEALPREEKRRSKDKAPPTGVPSTWDLAIALLGEQGVKEASARSWLGSVLKEWDEATVEDALRSSLGKAKAQSYVMGILRTKPKKNAAPEKPRLAM